MARRSRKLSFPKEHGALVTLAGATALAAVTAPRPDLSLLASAALVAAYLSRGPIERRVARLRLRPWDVAALLLYMGVAVAGVGWLSRVHGPPALAIGAYAAAFPIAGAVVRSARAQRSILVETAGMVAVGATAGVAVYGGGAALETAGVMAAGVGAYCITAVALVHAQMRDGPPHAERWLPALALALLAAGAAVSALLAPVLAAAFAPRAVHAALRVVRPAPEQHIYAIAARESAELAIFVALYAALLLA